MSAFNERRFGRFDVPMTAIEDNLAKYIFPDDMIPVRVEMDWCSASLIVVAASDQFDKVTEGISWYGVPGYDYELDFEMITDTDITGAAIGGHSEFRSIKWTKRNV